MKRTHNPPTRRWSLVGAAIALIIAVAAPAVAAANDGRHDADTDISRGTFQTLPGGDDLGFTVEGRAMMVRLAHHTLVHVRVRGLDAKTTYPAHVHDAPCSADPPGGSHYQHRAGEGPRFVNAVNEIWPEVRTNGRGRAHGHATHGHRARAEAMSIVIHYPADTSVRLACADLS